MDQLVFLALDQPGAVDLEFSLSGFPDLEPRVVYLEMFLIIEPSSSRRSVFPPWVFPGTICSCAYSRSELVEICYVFFFNVNLNLFS